MWALSAAETQSAGAACARTAANWLPHKQKARGWFLILNCEFQIISRRDYLSPSRLFLICSINGNSFPIKMSYPNEFNLRGNCLKRPASKKCVTMELGQLHRQECFHIRSHNVTRFPRSRPVKNASRFIIMHSFTGLFFVQVPPPSPACSWGKCIFSALSPFILKCLMTCNWTIKKIQKKNKNKNRWSNQVRSN